MASPITLGCIVGTLVFSAGLAMALPAGAEDASVLPGLGAPVDLEANPDQYRAVGIDENGEIISNIVGGVHSPQVDAANGRASSAMGSIGGNAAGMASIGAEPALVVGPTFDTIAPAFEGRQVNF